MGSDVDSDGPSADSALTFDDEGIDRDPASNSDKNTRLAAVWERSDILKELLTQRDTPGDDERDTLKGELVRQLPTVFLYGQMKVFLNELKYGAALSNTISLYVLLFPGEARDNTGIKDLNDKVIGQWWNGQYLQKRYDAIVEIFATDGFSVAAQTYKTAYILTYKKTRTDFAAKLALLDEKLQQALLGTLKDASNDKPTDEQKPEIKKLTSVLSKKGYRFDIFFGVRTIAPQEELILVTVYLLVTEAMKAAALARYVAKANTLATRGAKQVGAQPGIRPDAKKLDPRGKEYDWNVYLGASNMAEKIKTMVLAGRIPGVTVELNSIYVDTVWTFAFIKYENLYWGNPDTVRDVRKKKLERAPISRGNVTASFPVQKDLLELWLVVLNMLDFVKQFKSEEFNNQLQSFHDNALRAFFELDATNRNIDWDNLQFVLTHDVQQTDPIAMAGSASEFQFYSTVSDYRQRIFFSMDIRDLGVELMLDYEQSNREIEHHKYSNADLMYETFRSTDPTDARRRFTYDAVVKVFQKYYDQLTKSPGGASASAQQAFGGAIDEKLGSFSASVQIMLGGDEVYIATHPEFAKYVPAIIGELEQATYLKDRTIDMRASVALSEAKKTDAANQREATQKSHQEAMRLAELAPAYLKSLERTNRRIERLIEMVEANQNKKLRAVEYRKSLTELRLRKLFARLKYQQPQPLSTQDFAKFCALLSGGNPAKDVRFEVVDFMGKVIDTSKLEKDANALEDKVRKDVGTDNVQVHAPPIVQIPKWIEEIIKALKDKKPTTR